ncbi:MAG: winged helix-turn-helix transcriptional regulator [Candidatus Marinimicrobia bacterium]|jgi:ArsR family transcriptional regulator|nr:winged helix-turn-helix transcriptional regulator [Candidatus Neomarinimicrobiota bacterium]MBT3679483.1 winged helix-turn-helix transcriptional regulator [Candidatus Neomarinimicrobiota bacterium]MBT3951048.1 winged helix-turn-helix transcriptional regulator [Candidatus Neomarinimicrobiota bacterium]MBT4254272.1 winged helix-turn-helix transcriptional regulator [Candidatus Neomarinimicrobiota bacterium]MBT4479453.1 winged helix-turn-helix transcriptional regulator [Candidatus Neomarinimicro
MRAATNIYKALSDANRLRILMMLRNKPLCVCEIVEILELANSTVSKHLSILRNASLVMDSKSGRWVNYRISTPGESPDIEIVLAHLDKILDRDEQVASDNKKVREVDRYVICASPTLTVTE